MGFQVLFVSHRRASQSQSDRGGLRIALWEIEVDQGSGADEN